MMEWIAENKEWLFSGIAVAIPLAVLGRFISNRRNKQIQKSGDHSKNLQVGGDINIRSSENND